MTDEVAALVLRDNYFQTQLLSTTGRIAPALLDAQARFIHFLEKQGRLNRWIEFLPPDEEIAARHKAGTGLARPEAAVVFAYSKMWLYDEMLASNLPDDPWVATALVRYFPSALAGQYLPTMARHPLKREIIATHVINSMLNRVGSTFVHRLMETTGAKPQEIVRAYLLSREIFGLVPLWLGIEALDNKVADAVQAAMLIDASGQLERATTWFLRSRRLADDMAATIAHFRPGVEALSGRVEELLDAAERERVEAAIAQLAAAGVPRDLASSVTTLPALLASLDLAEVAGAAKKPVEAVAPIFFEIGNKLGVSWLRERIAALPGDAHWQILARSAMQDDLASLQRTVTQEVVAGAGSAAAADKIIAAWQDRNRRPLERVAKLLAEVRAAREPDASMLSVVLREMRSLA
jgi:glutamate dehydrogenase